MDGWQCCHFAVVNSHILSYACRLGLCLEGGIFDIWLQVRLLPGMHADEVMLDALDKAPVGIAIFSPDFFMKKWPMRELGVLVARDVLLPVVYRFNSHKEFVDQLRSSPHPSSSKEEWLDFVSSVERTTYIPRQQDYTGDLQQVPITLLRRHTNKF